MKRYISIILVAVLVILVAIPTEAASYVKADTDNPSKREVPVAEVTQSSGSYGLEKPLTKGLKRDIIEFGHYWQEDTNGDGVADENDEKTPIRWQVLNRNGEELFLLADKILDRQKYNSTYTNITWEKCSLRTWLNNDFYNSAFSCDERAMIKETPVINENNPARGTAGGDNTTD